MEKQYSVQFFTSFIENLQDVCRNYLDFRQVVEVSGYVCVEIDNVKKERYVLSELLQSSGNVVSESYCTKAFKTSRPVNVGHGGDGFPAGGIQRSWMNRNNPDTQGNRENMNPPNQNRRRSWAEAPVADYQTVPTKVRRASEVIDIEDETPVPRRMDSYATSPNQYCSPIFQGQRWLGSERTSVQSTPQNPVFMSRVPVNPVRQPGQCNLVSKPSSSQIMSPEHQRPLPKTVGPGVRPQGAAQCSVTGRVNASNNQIKQQSVGELGNISQFNVLRPPPSPVSNVSQILTVKSELDDSNNASCMKPEGVSNLQPSISASSFSQSCNSGSATPEVVSNIKSEPVASECTASPGFDEDEIIDLDLFEDEWDDIQSDVPPPSESKDDQSALARDYDVSSTSFQRKEGPANPGTQKVVMYAVNLFKNYHYKKSGKAVDPFSVTPEQLDGLLLEFYQGAKKMNGEELNARTLKNVQIHLDMYLREKGYCHSIAKDEKFHASRDFVKKRLDSYVATQSQKFTAVDDNDIEILFQRRILGAHGPDALFYTMWFLNSKYFAIRRPTEHFNLKWGDIQIKLDHTGLEYLERKINNSFSLKVFAKPHNPSQCFVNLYKRYWHLRPKESCLYETCPFYLSHCKGPNYPNPELWYINETMPLSRFQNIWRRLAVSGGLAPDKKII